MNFNHNISQSITKSYDFQEPGSPKEIEKFAAAKQAKFTLFEKCDVKGKNVSPVYAFLKEMSGKVCTLLSDTHYTIV